MENQTVNILMVDDRQENLLALEAVLTSPQYRLIKAHSGEEALKWVLKEEFSVILMDVQMPGLNGFDTVKLIRERKKSQDVPIIFITALSQTVENVLRGYSVGAIDYILKPLDPIILKCKVEGFVSIYLNRKKVEQQKEIIAERTKELELAYGQLKKNESMLRAIGETSIDSIITFSEKGDIVSVNPAVKSMFGYTTDLLIGKKIDLLLPDLTEQYIHDVKRQTIIEMQASRIDDSQFYVDIQLQEVQTEDGILFVCSIRDITEKKNQYVLLEQLVRERTHELISTNERLEEEIHEKQAALWKLEESRERYKSLFEYHPDAVFSADLQGNYISFNDRIISLTGRSTEELTNMSLTSILREEDRAKAINHFRECKKGVTQDFEVNILHNDGRLIETHVKNIPIIVNNQVIGVYGIIKDVSMEKRLWQQLYESEEKYRQLVEESPEAIIVRKLDGGNWSFINKTGVKLLKGTTREDFIDQNFKKFIHPDDHEKVMNNLKVVKERGKLESTEVKFLTLDGEVIDVEIKMIPFIYQGEPSLHIVLRDITELKKSREFIQQSEKLTVAGELAAGIAHEIRNPLTSLKGFTQLLEFNIGNDNDYVDIMISEIDRINTIVSELLLLAKPNKVDFQEIRLDTLFNSIITLMSAQANLHNVTINLSSVIGEDFPAIYGIENKIKQVFINLLKNGIEAMPSGGSISIRVQSDENHVFIQFIDEGTGIPEDILHKIGKPFYTTKESGTGLGLMVCFSIIESHQGVMKILSKEGKGTTVEVQLPISMPSLYAVH
ncbi:PAS domain S-box protein [Cytobacillus sp. FJAT-54145]|uniref:histidine kinase n=1 Tax=Cytobacillus spartinae TaxID=3299023 RepID=A0ABW6K9X4_9BACI